VNYLFAIVAGAFTLLAVSVDPLWASPAVIAVCASVDSSVRKAGG
jgi:hypothetical protein